MSTKKQIEKVARLEEQTGGFEGFNEHGLERRVSYSRGKNRRKGKHVIRLNLAYKALSSGDVVIQKQTKKKKK